jgi:hypothetical protein
METPTHTMDDHHQRRVFTHTANGFRPSCTHNHTYNAHECKANIRNQAVKNGRIDPYYQPFNIMEKLSISIFTAQELIISGVYLVSAVRILRVGESLQRKGVRRRIWMLILATIAIICIDICVVTLELMFFFGIWGQVKGFGYSVKLKIEFAILNELRASVSGSRHGESYDLQAASNGVGGVSLRSRTDTNAKHPGWLAQRSAKRQTFEQIEEVDGIEKNAEVDLERDGRPGRSKQAEDFEQPDGLRIPRRSQSSSKIGFASKGV